MILEEMSVPVLNMLQYVSINDKRQIMADDLVPMIRSDIRAFITSRRVTRHVSDVLEFSAKLLVMGAACMAFMAANSNVPHFVVISGLLNVGSISTFSLSSYFRKESSERTAQLNTTLNSIGICHVPDVNHDQ
jgi:hypothetical protein